PGPRGVASCGMTRMPGRCSQDDTKCARCWMPQRQPVFTGLPLASTLKGRWVEGHSPCYRYARLCRTAVKPRSEPLDRSHRREPSRRSPPACLSRLLLTTVMALAPISLAAPGTPTTVTRPAPQDVTPASPPTTADTGLLDALAPLFKEATGYTLKPIAVGSGA